MKQEQNNQSIETQTKDEINLVDIFIALWKKRGKIIVWSVIFAVIIIVVGGIIFLSQTKYQISELDFSLNFKGVDKGQYPNGSRFSTNDIIAVTVLQKVYDDNKLEKYYKDFDTFQSDISVFKNDFKLVALRSEYAAKLANKKLTVEDRDKFESEFRRLKAGILANSNFNLVLSGHSKVKLPSMLSSKVLNDTLKVWLNLAEREKGINKYRISLVTSDIISTTDIEDLDYIVGLDLLRETLKTVKADLNKVAGLPGSKLVTIDTDRGRTSLSDLKFKLNFVETFELAPLSGAIRSYGITKEGPLSMIYLKTKLYDLERTRTAILAVRKTYADTLKNYTNIQGSYDTIGKISRGQTTTGSASTIIPQFDGGFFDKIVSMAQQDANVKYRQKLTSDEISAALKSIDLDKEISYYSTLFEAFKKFKDKNSKDVTDNKELVSAETLIKKKQIKILNSITQIIKDTHRFYEKINEYSLNPQSRFYNIKSYTSVSIKSISIKKSAIIMILIWILLEVIMLGSVLLRNKITEETNKINR